LSGDRPYQRGKVVRALRLREATLAVLADQCREYGIATQQ
jgi:hypothetical protein